jgi:hypothetical protein
MLAEEGTVMFCSVSNKSNVLQKEQKVLASVNPSNTTAGRPCTEGGTMALERELATYKQKLPELKGQEGKFVLIHGDTLVDTFTSYDDAMKEGYAKFGVNDPFLVKQIHAIEQVQFISRFAEHCGAVRNSA